MTIVDDIDKDFKNLNSQKKKKRRNRHEKASHLAKISEYYLDGMSQSNIAKIIGISQPQVSQDLELVRQQWMKETIIDIDIIKAEQLKKIDKIEREMWACWEKSKRIKKSKVTRGRIFQQTGATPGSFELFEEEELGDTKFMDKIQWCISERLKITGGYAAKKIEADVSGKVEINNIAREEILAMIAAKEKPKELPPVQDLPKNYIDAEVVADEESKTIRSENGEKTYELLGQTKGFLCLKCNTTSWKEIDFSNRYCANCNVYHEDRFKDHNSDGSFIISPSEMRLDTFLNAVEHTPKVSVEGSAQEALTGRRQDFKITNEMDKMSKMTNFGFQE